MLVGKNSAGDLVEVTRDLGRQIEKLGLSSADEVNGFGQVLDALKVDDALRVGAENYKEVFELAGEVYGSARKLDINLTALSNAYKKVHNISDLVKENAIERSRKFSYNWKKTNIYDSISKLVGKNPEIMTTESGKIIYKGQNGVQAVHDYFGKYVRFEKTSVSGKRRYLDLEGKIPNNKVLPNGKISGNSKSEYEAATHFLLE